MESDVRSIKEILTSSLQNLREIFHSELLLAKVEAKDDLRQAARSAIVLSAGVILALYGLGFLLIAVAILLARFLQPSVAALIVALVLGMISAVLIGVGIKRWKHIDPKPEGTIRTMKENIEWMKQRSH